jgi:hypothetical protein
LGKTGVCFATGEGTQGKTWQYQGKIENRLKQKKAASYDIIKNKLNNL